MKELTAERARELLNYDPETGILTWRVDRGKFKAFTLAGSINQDGYLCITIDYRSYRAHRLAWLITHGKWPDLHMDHINGIRSDNRMTNIREATNAENSQNRAVQKKSLSGLLGAHWIPTKNRWRAKIKGNGKSIFLGYYYTAEEAHAAYCKAKSIYHHFQPVPRRGHAL